MIRNAAPSLEPSETKIQHCLAQAQLAHGTRYGGRYFGVEVGKVQAGLVGTAALSQIRDDGDQLRVVVQGLQLGLEQVLRDDEAGEAFAAVERRVGFDQGIQFGVRGVGDLVQALGAQGWAFGHGAVLGKRASRYKTKQRERDSKKKPVFGLPVPASSRKPAPTGTAHALIQ